MCFFVDGEEEKVVAAWSFYLFGLGADKIASMPVRHAVLSNVALCS